MLGPGWCSPCLSGASGAAAGWSAGDLPVKERGHAGVGASRDVNVQALVEALGITRYAQRRPWPWLGVTGHALPRADALLVSTARVEQELGAVGGRDIQAVQEGGAIGSGGVQPFRNREERAGGATVCGVRIGALGKGHPGVAHGRAPRHMGRVDGIGGGAGVDVRAWHTLGPVWSGLHPGSAWLAQPCPWRGLVRVGRALGASPREHKEACRTGCAPCGGDGTQHRAILARLTDGSPRRHIELPLARGARSVAERARGGATPGRESARPAGHTACRRIRIGVLHAELHAGAAGHGVQGEFARITVYAVGPWGGRIIIVGSGAAGLDALLHLGAPRRQGIVQTVVALPADVAAIGSLASTEVARHGNGGGARDHELLLHARGAGARSRGRILSPLGEEEGIGREDAVYNVLGMVGGNQDFAQGGGSVGLLDKVLGGQGAGAQHTKLVGGKGRRALEAAVLGDAGNQDVGLAARESHNGLPVDGQRKRWRAAAQGRDAPQHFSVARRLHLHQSGLHAGGKLNVCFKATEALLRKGHGLIVKIRADLIHQRHSALIVG